MEAFVGTLVNPGESGISIVPESLVLVENGKASSFSSRSTCRLGAPNETRLVAPGCRNPKYFPNARRRVILAVVEVGRSSELDDLRGRYEIDEVSVLPEAWFLTPGLVDVHTHASQYPNIGIGLDLPLLEWLDRYTFPLEAKYLDLDFASTAYNTCVKRTLGNGTTTACYFGTIHTESSKELFRACQRAGQRAFVGKVSMDRNSPEYYVEDTQSGIREARDFLRWTEDQKDPLVKGIVTPRFAVTSTEASLEALGEMARTFHAPVQTHISENKSEVEVVRRMYPDASSYADVYKRAGLFDSKCILAHGIYLDDDEIELVKERKAGIAHCPRSNSQLTSGMCDVRRLLRKGVPVGLGTDMSGGSASSILDAMRQAWEISKLLSLQAGESEALTLDDCFALATIGGARVAGLEDQIGSIEKGKAFDALVLSPDPGVDFWDAGSPDQLVHKVLMLGDDRNIKAVFVAGRLVAGPGIP
ncbi:unnamed protein product [Darwinula stevensoni]|uniref:Guanine deaminase n=1 Tax=Darwinula stevensoni TaxID=69355 RepID=A0A7R9FRB4_9CRUS|nr:unnamed protein product [Darwinula stevensoni]CAG0901088.1 unnamed protein product [Darwinula stevensoni]